MAALRFGVWSPALSAHSESVESRDYICPCPGGVSSLTISEKNIDFYRFT